MASEPSDAATPQPPRRGGSATGKQLLGASWRMLRQDRELLWLPFIGGIMGVVAAALLFVPGYGLGRLLGGDDDNQLAAWIGLALGTFGATIVAVFFQAALVIGANDRAEGQDPTRRAVLNAAWKRRGRILSWAVVTTTVGLALRVIQDRLGALGAVVGSLGGLAWGVATFLVVPVLVSEDIGPIAAVKRSASVLRQTWGTSLRTGVRFGLIALVFWLPAIAVFAAGVYVLISDPGAVGAVGGSVLLAVGFIALVVLGTVFSAISAYAKALIYRYATGRPTPGIDPALFAGAFRSKKPAV